MYQEALKLEQKKIAANLFERYQKRKNRIFRKESYKRRS